MSNPPNKVVPIRSGKKPQQSEPTAADLKHHRKHEILRAEEWNRMTEKFRRATPDQRKQYVRDARYEVSVQDLRDEMVGIVAATFGKGEAGWREVQARNGAHWTTLRNWDEERVLRPRMNKLREVALTCGHDLRLIDLEAIRHLLRNLREDSGMNMELVIQEFERILGRHK